MLPLNRIYITSRIGCKQTAITVRKAFWRKRFIEKQKECNSKKRIVLLHSGGCNSILLLHSWEIELSIRHHVTKINQLHHLNLKRYYIIITNWNNINIIRQKLCCKQVWWFFIRVQLCPNPCTILPNWYSHIST